MQNFNDFSQNLQNFNDFSQNLQNFSGLNHINTKRWNFQANDMNLVRRRLIVKNQSQIIEQRTNERRNMNSKFEKLLLFH